MKKIALLTSGGDAPGMNACIRAIVRAGENEGYAMIGVLNGYQGLIDGNFQQLSHASVENIIHLGGTILKTSRSAEFMTKNGFQKALKNIQREKFDALIVLGGDGTMHGAKQLMESGVNVICVPCTIDNDLAYTTYTIGFDTAINTVTEMLGRVRDTSASHERICVVEVMGRNSGDIALAGGVAVGAEVIWVPEVNIKLEDVCDKVKKSMSIGEKCVLVVVAEGVTSAENLAQVLKERIGKDVKSLDIGYIQRGGHPTANDRIFATRMGLFAVDAVKKGKTGIAIGGNYEKVTAFNLSEVFDAKKSFDEKLLKNNDLLSV